MFGWHYCGHCLRWMECIWTGKWYRCRDCNRVYEEIELAFEREDEDALSKDT